SRWRSPGGSTWGTCSATSRCRRRSPSRCCRRSTSASSSGRTPTSPRSTATSSPRCRASSTSSPPNDASPSSADMRVERELVVNAPRALVWDYVTNPDNYTLFFSGITRWEVDGRKKRGCGARYRMLMKVGSAEVGGLVEIVEFEEPGDMAWTSVLGVDQRGRWRLRDNGPNRTCVMFRLSYHAPRGLLGWLSDQLSAPIVRRNIKNTLLNLKRQIESRQAEQARKAPRKKTAARA